MLKTISAIMTVIFMSIAVMGVNVSAEEYEKNIVLTCESKDIDINEIPEDRTVDLLVSIENNPGFIVLGLTFDFDKRLSYPDWNYCKVLESEYGRDGIVHPTSFSIFEETGYLLTKVVTVEEGDVFYDNGALMKLSFRIPDNVAVGDEYRINFVRKDEWNTRLFFIPNYDDKYNEDYFDKLNSGIIRIVGDNTTNNFTESNTTEPYKDDKIVYEEKSDSEPSESKTEERIEALPVTSVTSFPVTTSEVSEIKKEITTLSVKTVETSSQVTSVASSAKASVTEIVTEEYKNIEYGKKEKNSIPLMIILAAAGVVLIAVRMKNR